MTDEPPVPDDDEEPAAVAAPSRVRAVLRTIWTVGARTVVSAWRQDPFSKAAAAAFWLTLSLPPLLLGLLGCVGYLGDVLGSPLVEQLRTRLLTLSDTVFTHQVQADLIAPTVTDTLTHGRGEVASVGFVLSLWAGSSGISSLVDAITAAHHQQAVRNVVWQRVFALLLYLGGLVVAVVALPVLALGPDLVGDLIPQQWQHETARLISWFWYVVAALVLVAALTTLYMLAPPRKLPWRRGLPGAVAGVLLFVGAVVGIRIYLSWIGSTGYTYGALAAPIGFLLVAFVVGLAVVLGAHLNVVVQQLWPARPARWWRRLRLLPRRIRIH